MSTFPTRAYFQISNMGKFGLVICELQIWEAGDIEKAARAIDENTVSFHLIEDGTVTDVSEDVAVKYMQLFSREIPYEDGELLPCDFLKRHVPDQLADLEGEIETEMLNNGAEHYRDYQHAAGF
jgi:hypothetical protein